MNRSPQYNQQSKPKVEEICNMNYEIFAKHGKWPSQHLHLKINTLVSSIPERIPSNNI